MYQIDKKLFGEYVATLRREKGLTQKELAKQLFISDKTVSKWERGGSIPDVTMLIPLAEVLGVTVTELLECHSLEQTVTMNTGQVEELVKKTLVFSGETKEKLTKRRSLNIFLYIFSIIACVLEIWLLIKLDYAADELMYNLMTMELLALGFGFYFVFLAKEYLPAYYDENKISGFRDGIFEMNLPGVSINNKNWPYILRTARIWSMVSLAFFPLLYWLLSSFIPGFQVLGGLIITLVLGLGGFFIPVYIAAKKHVK